MADMEEREPCRFVFGVGSERSFAPDSFSDKKGGEGNPGNYPGIPLLRMHVDNPRKSFDIEG
jgi:hypothetical protein